MKVPIGRSDRLVLPLVRQLSWLFSPIVVLLALVTMIAALAVLVANWATFKESAPEIFNSSNWIWLLGTWVALKSFTNWATRLPAIGKAAK